jgi:hypothetical protein
MFALIPNATKSWKVITHPIDLTNQTDPNLYIYTVKPPLVHRKNGEKHRTENSIGISTVHYFGSLDGAPE